MTAGPALCHTRRARVEEEVVSRIGERRRHAQAEPSAEYAHKRAAIVEAAARVFQHSGYERASMNDVAAQAVFVEIFLHGLVREPGPAR